MKLKPVPDNIRCATIDAKYIVIAQQKSPNGSYRAYVTDSDYIYDHVIMPALEDCATVTYCSPDYKEPAPRNIM